MMGKSENAVKRMPRMEEIRGQIRESVERAKVWCVKKLDRMVPPGLDWEAELKWLAGGLVLCAIVNLIIFLVKCSQAQDQLYDYAMGERVLRPDRVMAPFAELMQGTMVTFSFLTVIILILTVYHYLYYYQGSKSIYLMKRLPRRFEIHRRSFSLPLVSILVCLITVLLLIAIDYGFYYLITPKACLEPGQWSRFWESGVFLYRIWTGGGL